MAKRQKPKQMENAADSGPGTRPQAAAASIDLETFENSDDFKVGAGLQENIFEYVQREKSSPNEIDELANTCMQFIKSAEGGIGRLNEKRDVFSRIWRTVTGRANNERIQTDQDLSNAQKACLQLLQEMGRQMLLTQEQVAMLQSQLHYMLQEETDFRRNLHRALVAVFRGIQNRFEFVERVLKDASERIRRNEGELDRVKARLAAHDIEIIDLRGYLDRVERRVDTVSWVLQCELRVSELLELSWVRSPQPRMDRFLTAVIDFLRLKRNGLTQEDLNLFKIALKQLGFDRSERLSIRQFLIEFREQEADRVERYHDALLLSDSVKNIRSTGAIPHKSRFVEALNIMTVDMLVPKGGAKPSRKSSFAFLRKSNIDPDSLLSWEDYAHELIAYSLQERSRLLLDNTRDSKIIKEVIESLRSRLRQSGDYSGLPGVSAFLKRTREHLSEVEEDGSRQKWEIELLGRERARGVLFLSLDSELIHSRQLFLEVGLSVVGSQDFKDLHERLAGGDHKSGMRHDGQFRVYARGFEVEDPKDSPVFDEAVSQLESFIETVASIRPT